ncbi:MAG: hypothetical protein JSW46_04875 [Gemmatimonadota bacterium]|nr:MAG: hypothetical protein JSW46_04875 [Gemmatimonadota bacterium]
MMRSISPLAATLALALGCGGEALLDVPVIESEIVSTSEVMTQIDASRTYWSLASQVEPESLIVALWRADLLVSRAWQPLDDRCENPIGPRFTVELRQADPRILEYHFETGPGFLECSTTLEQFTVSE